MKSGTCIVMPDVFFSFRPFSTLSILLPVLHGGRRKPLYIPVCGCMQGCTRRRVTVCVLSSSAHCCTCPPQPTLGLRCLSLPLLRVGFFFPHWAEVCCAFSSLLSSGGEPVKFCLEARKTPPPPYRKAFASERAVVEVLLRPSSLRDYVGLFSSWFLRPFSWFLSFFPSRFFAALMEPLTGCWQV